MSAPDNFYVMYCITEPEKKGQKPGKTPVKKSSAIWAAKTADAFIHSRADIEEVLAGVDAKLLARRNKSRAESKSKDKRTIVGYQLGYRPAPGSEHVLLDLDDCRDPDTGKLCDWAEEVIGDYSGPWKETISGRGVRIPQPRAEGDELESSAEANDVGFFADGKKGATLPLTAEEMEKCYRDENMVQRLLARRDIARGGGARDTHSTDALGWLHHPVLSLDEMRDCLFAVPNVEIDRNQWIGFQAALKRRYHYIDDSGVVIALEDAEAAFDMFDDWTQQSEDHDYNLEHNRARWDDDGLLDGDGGMTVGTIMFYARKHGWSEPVDVGAVEVHGGGVIGALHSDQPDYGGAHDNLIELLDRLVLFKPKNKVIDLLGTAEMPLVAIGGATAAFTTLNWIEDDKWVIAMKKWTEHKAKMVTDKMPHLDPRFPRGFVYDPEETTYRSGFINTFRPFLPVPGVDDVEADWEHIENFVTLVEHVFPDPGDAQYVMDWIAFKLQNPHRRSVAIVSGTATFGTGRGVLFELVRCLMGETNCANVSASALYGKDSGKFNINLNNLIITVAESQEGEGVSTFKQVRAIYEKLKGIIDPDESAFQLERKNFDAVNALIFACVMIATNRADGMPVEAGDRRLSILRGNSVPLRIAHPDLLTWIKTVRVGSAKSDMDRFTRMTPIWRWLKARDVEGYEWNVPRHTAAKDEMVAAGASGPDIAIDAAIELCKSDSGIVTVKGVVDVTLQSRFQNTEEGAYFSDVPMDKRMGIVRSRLNGLSRRPAGVDTQGRKKVDGVHRFPRLLNGCPQNDGFDLIKDIEQHLKRATKHGSDFTVCAED